MPNRILRDWTDSEAVNTLSPEAERFFTRLIMKADDFGRYTADPKLLRPYLFPLLLESTREANLERWIAECEKVRLVRRYVVGGKPYLVVEKFGQRIRADVSRFPDPPPTDACPPDDGHVAGTCPPDDRHARPESEAIDGDGVEDVPPLDAAHRGPAADGVLEEPAVGDPPGFVEFWAAYPRHVERKRAVSAWRNLPARDRVAAMTALGGHVAAWDRDRRPPDKIPHPTSWLNGRRWEDELPPAQPAAGQPRNGASPRALPAALVGARAPEAPEIDPAALEAARRLYDERIGILPGSGRG